MEFPGGKLPGSAKDSDHQNSDVTRQYVNMKFEPVPTTRDTIAIDCRDRSNLNINIIVSPNMQPYQLPFESSVFTNSQPTEKLLNINIPSDNVNYINITKDHFSSQHNADISKNTSESSVDQYTPSSVSSSLQDSIPQEKNPLSENVTFDSVDYEDIIKELLRFTPKDNLNMSQNSIHSNTTNNENSHVASSSSLQECAPQPMRKSLNRNIPSDSVDLNYIDEFLSLSPLQDIPDMPSENDSTSKNSHITKSVDQRTSSPSTSLLQVCEQANNLSDNAAYLDIIKELSSFSPQCYPDKPIDTTHSNMSLSHQNYVPQYNAHQTDPQFMNKQLHNANESQKCPIRDTKEPPKNVLVKNYDFQSSYQQHLLDTWSENDSNVEKVHQSDIQKFPSENENYESILHTPKVDVVNGQQARVNNQANSNNSQQLYNYSARSSQNCVNDNFNVDTLKSLLTSGRPHQRNQHANGKSHQQQPSYSSIPKNQKNNERVIGQPGQKVSTVSASAGCENILKTGQEPNSGRTVNLAGNYNNASNRHSLNVPAKRQDGYYNYNNYTNNIQSVNNSNNMQYQSRSKSPNLIDLLNEGPSMGPVDIADLDEMLNFLENPDSTHIYKIIPNYKTINTIGQGHSLNKLEQSSSTYSSDGYNIDGAANNQSLSNGTQLHPPEKYGVRSQSKREYGPLKRRNTQIAAKECKPANVKKSKASQAVPTCKINQNECQVLQIPGCSNVETSNAYISEQQKSIASFTQLSQSFVSAGNNNTLRVARNLKANKEPDVPSSSSSSYLQNNQLILLCHSYNCIESLKDNRQCPSKECAKMKNILKHATKCSMGSDCFISLCHSTKQILNHQSTCTTFHCKMCSLLMKMNIFPPKKNK